MFSLRIKFVLNPLDAMYCFLHNGHTWGWPQGPHMKVTCMMCGKASEGLEEPLDDRIQGKLKCQIGK